jgi:hypothetical protein
MGKYVILTQVFSIVLISLLIGVTAMSCQLPSVPGPVNPGGPTPLPDSNADLSAISISSGSLVPAFDRGIHTYSVMVPSSISQISATGTPVASSSSVAGD